MANPFSQYVVFPFDAQRILMAPSLFSGVIVELATRAPNAKRQAEETAELLDATRRLGVALQRHPHHRHGGLRFDILSEVADVLFYLDPKDTGAIDMLCMAIEFAVPAISPLGLKTAVREIWDVKTLTHT